MPRPRKRLVSFCQQLKQLEGIGHPNSHDLRNCCAMIKVERNYKKERVATAGERDISILHKPDNTKLRRHSAFPREYIMLNDECEPEGSGCTAVLQAATRMETF